MSLNRNRIGDSSDNSLEPRTMLAASLVEGSSERSTPEPASAVESVTGVDEATELGEVIQPASPSDATATDDDAAGQAEVVQVNPEIGRAGQPEDLSAGIGGSISGSRDLDATDLNVPVDASEPVEETTDQRVRRPRVQRDSLSQEDVIGSDSNGDAEPTDAAGAVADLVASITTDDQGNTIFNSGEVTASITPQQLAGAGLDEATQEKTFNAVGDAVAWWDERVTQGELNVDVQFRDIAGTPLAQASATRIPQDGPVNGALEFDPAGLRDRTQVQIQQTAAHEIGHILSLEHLPNEEANILAQFSSRNEGVAQDRLDGGLTDIQLAVVGDYGLRERPNFTDQVGVEVADNGNTVFRSGEISASLAPNPELDDATRQRLSDGVARGVAFWDQFATQGSLESEITFVDIPANGSSIRADSGEGINERTGRIEIDLEEFSSLSGIQAEGLLVRTLGRNLGLPNEDAIDTVQGTFDVFRTYELEKAFDAGPNEQQIDQLERIGLRESPALAQFEVDENGDTVFRSGEVTATLRSNEQLDGLGDEVRDRLNGSIARGTAFWDQAITDGSFNSEISVIDIPAAGQSVRGNSGSGTVNRAGRIEIDLEEFGSISQTEAERLITKTLGANLGLGASEDTITRNGAPERVIELEDLFAAGPSNEQLSQLESIGLRQTSEGDGASADTVAVGPQASGENDTTQRTS